MSLWSMRPRSLLRPPAPFDGGCSAPLPAASSCIEEVLPEATCVDVRVVRDQHVVIDAATAAKRPRLEDAARRRSMVVLSEIAADYLGNLDSVLRIMEHDGTVNPDSPSFTAMLTQKSTSTLSKRASSLRMYKAWFCSTSAKPDQFLTENMIFQYFHALYLDSAPATRAASLREAVNFLQGVFNTDVSDITSSSRVLGMAVQLLRSKLETKQRRPLTVPMVTALETAVIKSDLTDPNLIVAGAALLGVFGRVRVGDMRRCAIEPQTDLAEGGRFGYMETRFMEHKTARPGTSRALPIAAPAFGLCATASWAVRWLEARSAQGLDASKQMTLLPALADRGWHDVAYTTPEFVAALRTTLRQLGFSSEALEGIGSHSLKATCLSWAAKAGVCREHRRILGYHVDISEKSAETYARDSLAAPLRSLDEVLEKIRAKMFDPDSTRSGLLKTAAGKGNGKDVVDETGSSTCPSAVSSASSVCSEDEKMAVPDDENGKLVFNTATRCMHISSGDGRLRCGRCMPKAWSTSEEVPEGMRVCPMCF